MWRGQFEAVFPFVFSVLKGFFPCLFLISPPRVLKTTLFLGKSRASSCVFCFFLYLQEGQAPSTFCGYYTGCTPPLLSI